MRAASVSSHMIGTDEISVPLDQRTIAVRTARVLPCPNLAWQIACVIVSQARLGPDLACSYQLAWRRRLRIGHAIILVERRHVPRNIPANASEELRDLAQLAFAVVEARNDQRHDFEPDAALVDHADGF